MPARTVILVHGAFADGTSWRRVIPMVKRAGLNVISVQIPLETLEQDVAFTQRAIELSEGPIVLVGHDWGGVVITEAGCSSKIKSLVYVAAFIPDAGQSLLDIVKCSAESPVSKFIQRNGDGYVRLSDEGVFMHLAPDLPRSEQEIVAATQGSIREGAISQAITRTAWRDRPTFVLVTTNDSLVSAQLQRDQARRISAISCEVASSHLVTLTHPEAVSRLILDAAR
ncbi:MAG: alpha/beta hydrolase [Steroidobacteraceae bacterium]